MDPVLAGYRAYLGALHDAASGEPVVHAVLLATIGREQAIAGGAAAFDELWRAGGGTLELARAATVDRLIGRARGAASLDDPWATEAAAIELDGALTGTTFAVWQRDRARAQARAAVVRGQGAGALAAFGRVAIGLVRMHGERRPAEHAALARAVADGAAELAAIDRVLVDRARYRRRLPWGGARAHEFRRWMLEVIPGGDVALAEPGPALQRAEALARDHAGPPDGPRRAPALGELIAPHLLDRAGSVDRSDSADGFADDGADLDDVPAGDDVPSPEQLVHRLERAGAGAALLELMRGAPTCFDALAAAVNSRLLAELARAPHVAAARAARARQRVWPEPLLEHHAGALFALVARARTAVALDVIASHLAACLDVEATWLGCLIAAVTGPLRAALVAMTEPSAPAVTSIAAAREVAVALIGEPDPWRIAWLEELVTRNLVPHATGALDELDPRPGEVGFDLLPPWRAWNAGRLALRQNISLDAARALTATDEPSWPERRRLRMWDREVGLDELDRLRAAPPRPPVPGLLTSAR